MENFWKKIIEANVQELSITPDFNHKELDEFKKGRLAYFRNDLEGINKALFFFNKDSSELYKICSEVFKLRLWVRTAVSPDISQVGVEASANFMSSDDQILKMLLVELLSVEAIACDLLKEYDKSYLKNMKAYKIAESLNLGKKASILFYNGIVSENHKAPSNIRLSKLSDSIAVAEKYQDLTTATAARTSLSNEYQLLGCQNLAYEEMKKALETATSSEYGGFNHGACLIGYAKICVSMERFDLAKEAVLLLESFDFKEFKSAVENLQSSFGGTSTENPISLSGDEQKIIEILSQGPRSKYDIIEKIYGQGSFESLDNRFKQLLVRVRKKRGRIIVFNKVSALYEMIL